MVVVFFMFAKWWKFTIIKKIGFIISIYFKFSTNWIRFIMISKIKLRIFQVSLMLKFFICLILELLKLLLNFYSLRITFFFFEFCDFMFLVIFWLFTFF
jgi:hypothetical protein